MIISHQYKFIFIHINKCAGNSIASALLPLLDNNDEEFGYTNRSFKKSLKNESSVSENLPHKHATAMEIRAYLGKDIYESYTTFTAIRNPFDRLVPAYAWWFKEHNYKPVIKAEIMDMSFDQYLQSKY